MTIKMDKPLECVIRMQAMASSRLNCSPDSPLSNCVDLLFFTVS